MRVVQPEGTKGSLKWMQRAVERRPDLLQPPGLPPIDWVSPLRTDDFAEYRDAAFLGRLGLAALAPALAGFWPQRGPQWDALGRSGNIVILVEGKAHLPELVSPPSKASEPSLEKIRHAFAGVQADLCIAEGHDWTQGYYQYANRFAHLSWLRRQDVDAHLVFVDFLKDAEMPGPEDRKTWRRAYEAADAVLGLPREHALSAFIHHVHPDVTLLT